MFEIGFSTKVKRELDKMDEKYREKILMVLKILSLDPVPAGLFDVKKLTGLPGAFRIRIGKIRIVYAVDWMSKQIVIARIGERGKMY